MVCQGVCWHRVLALIVLSGQAPLSVRAQDLPLLAAPDDVSSTFPEVPTGVAGASTSSEPDTIGVTENGVQTCNNVLVNPTPMYQPQCAQFVKEDFLPKCIPDSLQAYTFLSGLGHGEEPYVYNTWMFIQACGLNYTAYRATNQLPRRAVVTHATEAILINWGIYFFATMVGAVVMNVFYVSPKGKRCWGCFLEQPDPDEYEPGCSYQKVVAPIYTFCVFPLALFLLAACCYQFFMEQWDYRKAVRELRGSVCYPVPAAAGQPPGVLMEEPQEICEDIMRLDWVCNKEMLQILLMTAFCMMDSAFLVGVKLYTLVIMCFSCFRVWCCCCGCMVFKAICKRPDCMCSSTCTLKICCSWFWCHPSAMICINFILVPLVIGLYFIAGTFGAVLAYGLIAMVVILILLCMELIIRQCIQLISCGKCEIHGMPLGKYFHSLFPTPKNSLNPGSFKQKEHTTGVGDMYAYDHPINKAEHPSEPGWEENTMGAPCHAVTLGYPIMLTIITMPILLVVVVCVSCFLWEDYLTRILAWGYGDMKWYYGPSAMEPGWKAWKWWWQVFQQLLAGMTDAFKEIFEVWWHFLRDCFSGDTSFWDDFTDLFSSGLNPLSLFSKGEFAKFRSGLLFYRFVLTFIFTCCRATALVNWSSTKDFMADEELDYLYK